MFEVVKNFNSHTVDLKIACAPIIEHVDRKGAAVQMAAVEDVLPPKINNASLSDLKASSDDGIVPVILHPC